MRKCLFRSVGLMLAALLCIAGSVRADSYTATYNYEYNEQVGISFTTALGEGPTAETSPVPFTVTDTSVHGSQSFQGFCIDLWHDEHNPANFVASTITSNFSSQLIPGGVTPFVTGSQLGSQLNYIGYVYSSIKQSDAAAVGAVQLAIWHLIDKNFQVTSYTDPALHTDYNAVLGLLGGTNHAVGSSGTILGYGNVSLSMTAQVLVVNQNVQKNQNVITWSGNFNAQSVPEPSTLAIAGLGALAFTGYGLRRRKDLGT